MIICPNCNHQNPGGAVQCEACYTPLPAMTTCPSCGTAVQADASFCGQCGTSLSQPTHPLSVSIANPQAMSNPISTEQMVPPPPPDLLAELLDIPDLSPPDPLINSEVIAAVPSSPGTSPEMGNETSPGMGTDLGSGAPISPPSPVSPEGNSPTASVAEAAAATSSSPQIFSPEGTEISVIPQPDSNLDNSLEVEELGPMQTRLQRNTARLLHIQTDALIELPDSLSTIRIGKANDRVPPDIDVSGFPDSEIVSRVHANIRIEGDTYYVEDVGSSNGTYINSMPLLYGNRHRLRPGDRIALGKGDKVSFIFQIT